MSWSMLLGSASRQLFSWLVIVYYLDDLLSDYTHLAARAHLFCFSMSLWYSKTILWSLSYIWHEKDILRCHNIHSVQESFALSFVGGTKNMIPATQIICFMTPEYSNVYAHAPTQTHSYICLYQHTYVKVFISMRIFLYFLGILNSFWFSLGETIFIGIFFYPPLSTFFLLPRWGPCSLTTWHACTLAQFHTVQLK